MKNFEYIKATDLKSAFNILDQEKGRALPVAGTTNVMVDIRAGKINDCLLVNIKDIDVLTGFKYSRGKISIGALTTISEIAESVLISKKAPALWMAANTFADPTTRNSATIGGNIAYASPAADTAPALLALGAEVLIGSKAGKRRVPISEFFVGVNKTVLEKNELVLAVEFAANNHSAFYKLGLRNAMAISVATAAAAVRRDKLGNITHIAVAMGSVYKTPLRCYNVEKALTGKSYINDKEMVKIIEKALIKDISPIDDVRASAEYRLSVAPALVNRVIAKSCGMHIMEGGRK